MGIDQRELPATGILQSWVAKLGLRHQGVLLTAVRGCDTEDRHGPSKLLTRAYRGEILHTHAADPKQSRSFIEVCEADELLKRMNQFAASHDHLPHHFTMHFIHAAEIVGYYGPSQRASYWYAFYFQMCNKFHMSPETKIELDHRLGADEEKFANMQ